MVTEPFSATWVSNTVVRFSGRLDASQAAAADEALARAVADTQVDFSELDYIASAGIGCLLAALKRLRKSGASLRLVGLNAQIRELFELAGFDTVFEIGES